MDYFNTLLAFISPLRERCYDFRWKQVLGDERQILLALKIRFSQEKHTVLLQRKKNLSQTENAIILCVNVWGCMEMFVTSPFVHLMA